MAVANSPIMSVALWHISWAPKSTSLSAANSTFMNPCSSLEIIDCPFTSMIYLPQRREIPFLRASSSVIPTDAISGSVYRQLGTMEIEANRQLGTISIMTDGSTSFILSTT